MNKINKIVVYCINIFGSMNEKLIQLLKVTSVVIMSCKVLIDNRELEVCDSEDDERDYYEIELSTQ